MGIVLLLLILAWAGGNLLARRRLSAMDSWSYISNNGRLLHLSLLLCFDALVEAGARTATGEARLQNLHAAFIHLERRKRHYRETKHFVAISIAYGYGALLACCLLAWSSGEQAILLAGAILLPIIPLLRWREIEQRSARRKRAIILALPDLASKLMLLASAGETVRQALYRCLEGPAAAAGHPLYDELRQAVNELHNGFPLPVVLEGFSRRCAVQEASMLTTAILLNYKRGGELLALSLRELIYTMWEKRKSLARVAGEEASSKLVFPLIGIFIVLMVVVASPVVLLIS